MSTTVSSVLKVASFPRLAVVADANPPKRVGPGEHPTSRWTWSSGERFDAAEDPAGDTWRKPLQVSSRGAGEEDVVFTHGPVAVVGDGDGP